MSGIRIPSFEEVLAVSRSQGRLSEAPDLFPDFAWLGLQGGGHTWLDVTGRDTHG
ncbi:unnamed protein product, partial [marine sediment metagenome]